MSFSDFRTNASWQAAIDLGPGLVRLAEELPASEQLGLAFQVQQTMVELPAAIAFDLGDDARTTRIPVALRLVAALDLIERIYPALDTADIRSKADSLVRSIIAGASHAAPAAPALETPVLSHPVAGTHIPITTDSDAPAPQPGHPAPSVIIAPAPAPQAETQDDHVHPDSSQQAQ